MQRFGRKLDVDRLRTELPLAPFVFDCIYLDSGSMIRRAAERRFAALASVAAPLVVPARARPTREEAAQFLDEMLRRGHEGVMVKALGAGYAAGRCGRNWLKVKAARTLDLVVLAADQPTPRKKVGVATVARRRTVNAVGL